MSFRKRPGATRGATAKAARAASVGTNTRCRRGISSPTGTPLRVTMNAFPLSRARMIRPLSLRSSRWVIRRLIAGIVARALRRAAIHIQPSPSRLRLLRASRRRGEQVDDIGAASNDKAVVARYHLASVSTGESKQITVGDLSSRFRLPQFEHERGRDSVGPKEMPGARYSEL